MSEGKGEKRDKQLEELLKKQGPEGNLDAFEREALEGFAMLKNGEEAHSLKASLDRKIYAEVFNNQKKSNNKYWYAAAGVFMLLSFSVYLFIQNTLKDNQPLADNRIENTENLEDSLPVAANIETADNKLQKNTTTIENKDVSSSLKTFNSIEPENSQSSRKTPPPQRENLNDDAKETPVTKSLALAAEKEDKQMEVKTVDKAEDVTANDIPATASQVEADKPEYKTVVLEAATKKAKSSARQVAPAAASGYNGQSERVDSNFDINKTGTANYVGGDEAFQKDLKILMEESKLSNTFDAVLWIGKDKKVMTVTFVNSKLSKKETKIVTEILIKMEKFEIADESASVMLYGYKFSYKP